jgi:hypothetical protein
VGQHRWTSRYTVEECLPLDVERMRREGTFGCPPGTIRTILWKNSWGGNQAMLAFEIVLDPAWGMALSIDPELANIPPALKLPAKYLVPIATTRPHFGGIRFWFRCPVARDGKPCGKLAGRLYLPPEQQVFACRDCHNLTYASVQTHDQRQYDLARDLVALNAALGSKDLRRARLGIGGLALQIGRMRRGR